MQPRVVPLQLCALRIQGLPQAHCLLTQCCHGRLSLSLVDVTATEVNASLKLLSFMHAWQ
jgi:hypothetical protein